MIKFLCIIQARLGSKRLPNKVMMPVGGIPMVKRVWMAAKGSKADKVIVAWPERYPDLDQNNVFERFYRIIQEFAPRYIIRLTADCPLLTSKDIDDAIEAFDGNYYNNRRDGHDVQIFDEWFMLSHYDKEHVIADTHNKGGDSVNTKEDLERVRRLI